MDAICILYFTFDSDFEPLSFFIRKTSISVIFSFSPKSVNLSKKKEVFKKNQIQNQQRFKPTLFNRYTYKIVIIPSKTQVNPSHKRHRLINNHTLLVMRPKEHIIHEQYLPGMSKHHNIRILSLLRQNIAGSETHQIGNERYFFIQENIYLHAFLSFLK